jgi:poly(A) polymerase
LLREQAGEETEGLGTWWTDFQELPMEQRLQQVASDKGGGGRGPRRRRHKESA